MHDFLALDELAPGALDALIARARALQAAWDARRMPRSLDGVRMALVVDDGGWRNTTAFDLGIQAMGGLCVTAPLSLDGGREAIADLAGYLDNWIDGVVIRTPELEVLRAFANAAHAPVVNARTRQNHPCETLGDLCFVAAQGLEIDGLRVAVIAPDANILWSWIEAAAALPATVTQIYPRHWHAAAPTVERFCATTDMAAVAEADVVVTDCWPPGGAADQLRPYQITTDVIAAARPETLFLPCPPVTRGQEVSADAMASPRVRSTEAKTHLLHAQNAVLEWCLGKP